MISTRSLNRKNVIRTMTFLVVALAVVPVWTTIGQDADSRIPPEVAENTNQWPMANQNYRNTRTAAQSTISTENVDELGVAWAMPIPGAGQFGAAASAPLIANDTAMNQ